MKRMQKGLLAGGMVLALLGGQYAAGPTTSGSGLNDLRSQQTDLNIIWEVQPSPNDKMSTVDRPEAALFPMVGQAYYVPRYTATGRNTLYRLFNGTDHRPSMTAGEGGYATEGPLGYPWNATAKPLGTVAMNRGYNAATGDYAIMPAHLTFPGYAQQALPQAYGYARYGSDVPLLQVTGNAITVKSNLAAGGSVWELWWNGKQMIDNLDYGREIQASMSFTDSVALPTEGGDYTYHADKSYMHGSPVASSSNTLTSAVKKHSTRSIPLEWNFPSFNGGLTDVPVIYHDWQLGKDLFLDDQSLDLGTGFNHLRDQVIRYETVLDIPETLYSSNIEIPTAYLSNDMRRGFTFDATQTDINAGLQERLAADYNELDTGVFHLQYNVQAGGVIYATDDLNYALGIYGSSPDIGGSAKYFTLWKFGAFNNPSVTKWSAGNGWSTFTAGENRFTTYIIAGTLDEVRVAMRRLYIMGYR